MIDLQDDGGQQTGWMDGEVDEKEEESERREVKTCKPKVDSNKLIMQHKTQTFMCFMKLAEALK